ncbi:MAG: glycoside hydrolase family 3 C-terminal domain-containing protein [Prevotella sp.]|jgi:beta-glucosidase|nr:glycoside hydrolase family 3 C-terminal domain-containing protein [Prevotella sp.]
MKKLFIAVSFLSILFCGCNKNSSWQSFSKDKTIEQKVDSVLALMTLDEKIAQMTQFASNGEIITGPASESDVARYLREGTIGSVFNTVTVENNRTVQDAAMQNSRLKIPVLIGFDVIHGFRTIFPMPLAESCSWDLDLMRKTANIAAQEASSVGIHWTFAPMVDIARDARWGRVMEGAGEDPYLGSLIAQARVKGFQGESWESLKETNTILACAKHFAAYGAAEAGRDYNVAELSERTLHEIYLPPYKAANEAGVATYMTAFNEIGGVPCTGSKYLFTDLLRKDWGFGGFAVSDHTAVKELIAHGVAKDEKEAAALAVNAGVDMDMADGVYIENLKKAVEEGLVSESVIDNSVRRILEMKFILGLFDDPYRYLSEEREKSTLLKPEFLETARDAVRKSVVLLKNDNSYFPLDKNKGQTVALIGPMVKNQRSLNGEWAGRGNRNESVSLFDGLMEKYKDSKIRFVYAEGCDLITNDRSKFMQALSVARQADIILVAMGEDFNWSGEAACRTDIRLPGAQQELLKELKKLNKKVGLVLFNGRPLDLSWEHENIDAILEAWYPGTMAGHGVADVIAGDYNPSAKLTISFPRNVGQVPIYYNHKNTGRPVDPANPKVDYRSFYLDVDNSPLYSFGYGLSYTSFSINNLKLDKTSMTKGGSIVVTADVTNTGKYDGAEVVQLYIHDITASVTRPVKELKGFEKVSLKAGETKQVKFEVSEKNLMFYDLNMNYTAEPGAFKLWVASSSADETNEADFELE